MGAEILPGISTKIWGRSLQPRSSCAGVGSLILIDDSAEEKFITFVELFRPKECFKWRNGEFICTIFR